MSGPTPTQTPMSNGEIARALIELADQLERSGAPKARYRARALRTGAHAIDALAEPAVELLARGTLTKVRGIGDGIARRIQQLVVEGRFPDLEAPAEAPSAARPRRRRTDDLPGLQFNLGEREIEPLAAKARALPGVRDVDVAGEIRRRKDMVTRAALVVSHEGGEPGDPVAAILDSAAVAQVIAREPDGMGATVRTRNELVVDVRVVPPRARGTALALATGGEAHVTALLGAGPLPERATEEEVYAALGLPWIPPELREGRDELAAARGGRLPRLVCVEDLRGDLHMHTTETDGRDTLEDMVAAAVALGREYVAITDHSQLLRFVNGLDPARLRAQGDRIRALEERLGGRPRILRGIEADILVDGSIDMADALGDLDWVIGSVHSHFDLPREEQTRRLVKAIESGVIDVVGHPTGRMLGRRKGIDVDVEAVARAAARCGVLLELNSYPDRLDLRDEHARVAMELGASFVIDTDSHATSHLRGLRHGVDQARRGWLEPRHVVNTLPVDELLARRGRTL